MIEKLQEYMTMTSHKTSKCIRIILETKKIPHYISETKIVTTVIKLRIFRR